MRDFKEKYENIFNIVFTDLSSSRSQYSELETLAIGQLYDSEKGGFAEIEWMKIDYGILNFTNDLRWEIFWVVTDFSPLNGIPYTVYRNSKFNGSK